MIQKFKTTTSLATKMLFRVGSNFYLKISFCIKRSLRVLLSTMNPPLLLINNHHKATIRLYCYIEFFIFTEREHFFGKRQNAFVAVSDQITCLVSFNERQIQFQLFFLILTVNSTHIPCISGLGEAAAPLFTHQSYMINSTGNRTSMSSELNC